jgi:hypothetical protein
VISINAPERLGGRGQAREFVSGLPDDLTGETVVVSFAATKAARPSYIDELIRVILEERGADRLMLSGLPSWAKETANRSGVFRGLLERLEC